MGLGSGVGDKVGKLGWAVTPLPNPTPTCSRRRRRRRRRRRPRRHDNDEDVDDNDDYYRGYEDNDEENNNLAISVAISAQELLAAGHRSARLREAPMAATFLEAEDWGLGSYMMVRAPMTPSSLLQGEERINDLDERIHDLESGMRLAFQNLGELRQQQTALHSWLEWFGRIRHWMANCARAFPGL